METTYVLIADAHRARCFEREASSNLLIEQADFVAPQTRITNLPRNTDLSGAAGKGHGRTGHAGTQFEPKTELPDKERSQFARELAQYVNTAVNEHRCDKLVLIATSTVLGDLKPQLNSAATLALSRTIAKDLTHYTGPELAQRVNHALELQE